MRCMCCCKDKPAAHFARRQCKKPADKRKCVSCAAAANAASNVDGAARPTPAATSSGDARESTAEPPAPTAVASGGASRPPSTPLPPRKVCAWSGCGKQLAADLAEQKKCGRCKSTFYCSRRCQKQHWAAGGHKEDCEEPPCCTICLEGGEEPLPMQRGCACRGDSGLAHVACLAEVAARKAAGYHAGWDVCPMCGQSYTGEAALDLAQEFLHRTRHLSWRDPGRLAAMHHLGGVLSSAGAPKFGEAEAVFRKTLARCRLVYGTEHRDTLRTANGLAGVLAQLGKHTKAEALLRKVNAVHTRLHGEEHIETIRSMNGLASMLHMAGKYKEAEPLMRKALAWYQRTHRDDDEEVLQVATNLGNVLLKSDQYAEAEAVLRKVLVVQKRVFGNSHPITMNASSSLGAVLLYTGRIVQAEAALQEVVALRERVQKRALGGADADVINLARCAAARRAADLEIAELKPLHTGLRVRLMGLSASSMNGVEATITGLRTNDHGRWAVTTDDGRAVAVKPANLQRVIVIDIARGVVVPNSKNALAHQLAGAGVEY